MDPSEAPKPPRAFGVFALVGQSFHQFFARFGTFFAFAFAPALLVTVLSRWTGGAAIFHPAGPAASPAAVVSPGLLLLLLANLILGAAVAGFMSLVALDVLLGKRHGVGQYLSQTLRRLPPLVVLTLVYYIAAGIGFVLLIVPGLYILARYSPLVPAIVFEDTGWAGLTRARDLTRGYRWPLVGLLLALSAIFVVFATALGFALAITQPVIGGGIAFLAEVILTALYTAYGALVTGLVYLRLRALNEGMSLPDIAATID